MTAPDRTPSTASGFDAGGNDTVHRYEIRVDGRLALRWSAWFDGMTITPHDDGTTVIAGAVADQSALYGLLERLRDLGIPLISIHQTPPDPLGSTERN